MLTSNYSVCKMKILIRQHLKIHMKFNFPMVICWQRTRPRMESSTRSTHQVISSTNRTSKTRCQSILVRRKSWWTNNTIINSTQFYMRSPGLEVANRHQLPAISCDQLLPQELCCKVVANHDLLQTVKFLCILGSTDIRIIQYQDTFSYAIFLQNHPNAKNQKFIPG